jgi:hypothetical protein
MMCFSLDYLLRQVVVLIRRYRRRHASGGNSLKRRVLGIVHPQEAMGGSLIVAGHELCDRRAVVAEFGTARLNNRNADPKRCNFLLVAQLIRKMPQIHCPHPVLAH